MNTVLYVGGYRPGGDPLGLLARPDARRVGDGTFVIEPIGQGGDPMRLVVASDPAAAIAWLGDHHCDAVVVDARARAFAEPGDNPCEPGPFAMSRAGALLARLHPEGEVHALVPRDRVLGIVEDGPSGVDAAFELGAHGVGGVLRSPDVDALLARLDGLLSRRAGGRIAICLAGGGIEGLLYEVGVLRALDSFMVDRSLVDVDMFCGISAGALLGALLANGIGPNEIARGLAGGSARIDPVRRSDIFDPNFKELGSRAMGLVRDLLRGGSGPRRAVSSVARALPTGIFAGDRLRDWTRRQLEKPGMTDRFDELRRPLYVGATDQDTSQAVVFGEEGLTHVPIHRAVRASAALVPFYSPEKIDGRYYIDGAFSRTTNMRVAVRHGATLVILIDPLVPVFSEEAGYVYARGGMYSSMQGLKALVNGRFDKAIRAIREMFPDVSFYLFRPEGDEMRMLSGSPMKYFYRREIEDVAYRDTVRKMRALLPEMQRDFALHGVKLRDPEDRGEPRIAPPRFEPSAIGVFG